MGAELAIGELEGTGGAVCSYCRCLIRPRSRSRRAGPARIDAAYCSAACRQKAYRRRNLPQLSVTQAVTRRPLKVLVACERSGRVRDAFSRLGHMAVSCDLALADTPGLHFVGDVRSLLGMGWDLLIAHPPCTRLAISGRRWWHLHQAEQEAALEFVRELAAAPVGKICIENPIGRISTAIRRPEQIIQPWQFGHGECKATCLWLKGLPLLEPTRVCTGRAGRLHSLSSGEDRSRVRSVTFQGVADAMAMQWGGDVRYISTFQVDL